MAFFKKVKQLPPDVEAQLEAPLQVAIKILQSAGATNEELQDPLAQAAVGVVIPIARLDDTLETMFIATPSRL